jgi:hypothetical protein
MTVITKGLDVAVYFKAGTLGARGKLGGETRELYERDLAISIRKHDRMDRTLLMQTITWRCFPWQCSINLYVSRLQSIYNSCSYYWQKIISSYSLP